MLANARAIITLEGTQYVDFTLENFLLILDCKNPLLFPNYRTFSEPILNYFSVITDLKFAQKEGIIFLQPQIGRLIGKLEIDEASLKWWELPGKSEIDEKDLVEIDYHKRLSFRCTQIKLQENSGYITGKFMENPIIFLSDQNFPGIRLAPHELFRNIIQVEIYGEKFKIKNQEISQFNRRRGFSMNGGIVKEFQQSSELLDAGQTIEPNFVSHEVGLTRKLPLISLNFFYYENPGDYDNKFIGIQLETADVMDDFLKSSLG